MKAVEWSDDRIRTEVPKNAKRITGTRFASILGLDRWSSPFKTWCAITRTYEEPFVDNKYTVAGKTIEPKVIDYLNKVYFFGALNSPTDIYGPDYFKKTWGNFFPEDPIFGGMWDAVLFEHGKVVNVIEIKTTKRSEDWVNGAPIHYALQACLYAYLLGVDEVTMVVSFLEEKDYAHPEDFIPSSENTMLDQFKVSERYPMFPKMIDRATEWWNEHVVAGVSPPFDEKADSEILIELRKNRIDQGSDINTIVAQLDAVKAELDAQGEKLKGKEKQYKELAATLKAHCEGLFRDGDNQVSISGPDYDWVLTKSSKVELDQDALKADGLFDKYSVAKETLRFAPKRRK